MPMESANERMNSQALFNLNSLDLPNDMALYCTICST